MNASLSAADGQTHVRIVATALAAATVFLWVGVFAHQRTGAVSDEFAATIRTMGPAASGIVAGGAERTIR